MVMRATFYGILELPDGLDGLRRCQAEAAIRCQHILRNLALPGLYGFDDLRGYAMEFFMLRDQGLEGWQGMVASAITKNPVTQFAFVGRADVRIIQGLAIVDHPAQRNFPEGMCLDGVVKIHGGRPLVQLHVPLL